MKCLLTLGAILSWCATTFAAEPLTDALVAPSKFIGKTFEECEKILGNPISEEKLIEWSQVNRVYKSPFPGINKIKLMRGKVKLLPPQKDKPFGEVSETVTKIEYFFPNGKFKTWKEAANHLGLKPEGVKEEPLSAGGAPSDLGALIVKAANFPEAWNVISWIPYASTKGVIKSLPSNEDTMSFAPEKAPTKQISPPDSSLKGK